MGYDLLTTSGINSTVNTFIYSEQLKRLEPLQQRKSKYETLNSVYGSLSSKLDSFKSILQDLAKDGTSSIYNSRAATTSNTDIVDVSVSSKAAASSYQLKVNQLAQSDSLLSSTMTAVDATTLTAGTQAFRFRSGDYETNLNVEFDGTETNQEVMEKIRDAINNDSYASVTSAEKDKNTSFTMDATNNTFDIKLNDDTTTTVTIDSSQWASITNYDTLYDVLIENINEQVDGVKASKVEVEGTDNIQLKIATTSSTTSLTINSTGLDGNGDKVSEGNSLMDDLGIVSYNEKGAKTILTASVFNPTSDTSKLSIVASESGYSNRLLIDSNDALTSIGLTSDILTNRYKNTDDGTTTNDTEAGFTYGTKYLDSGLVEQGTAETETNNMLNAQFEFNGISVYRDSNIVKDLLEGVTLTLKDTSAVDDPLVNIDVTSDTSSIKSSIEEFVKQFNSVYGYIKENSKTTEFSRGVLIGDATASSIMNSFTSFAYKEIDGFSDAEINRLADIGITFDPTVGLSIEDDVLSEKIENSADLVQNFFNAENGLANLFIDKIEPALGSTGSLAKSQESFENTITSISDRISYTQTSIDKSAELLRQQYEDMQLQLSSLLEFQGMLTGDYGSDIFQ